MSQNLNSSNSYDRMVLKDNYTIDKSDFEKIKLAEEYNQLSLNENTENLKNQKMYENKKIFNLSINELLSNSSFVYMKIVSELSNYIGKKDKNLNELGLIFTKDDRLLYVGLFFLVLSFFLWIINILG